MTGWDTHGLPIELKVLQVRVGDAQGVRVKEADVELLCTIANRAIVMAHAVSGCV